MRTLLIILLFISTSVYALPEISPNLAEAVKTGLANNQPINALVILEPQLDVRKLDKQLYLSGASIKERVYRVITALRSVAENSRHRILQKLKSFESGKVKNVRPFWIYNMIALEASADVLVQLAKEEQIVFMDLDNEIRTVPDQNSGISSKSPGLAEPNLKVIKADELWKLGYSGSGRILMTIDIGADPSHPAIGWRWRGNLPDVPDSLCWHDPVNGSIYPYDFGQRGTTLVGIMCGLDQSTHDTIGVAFGANWIASNAIITAPLKSNAIASMQWAMDPDGNPATISDMPDAICNAWYDVNSSYCDSIYASVFNSVEAAGIALIFAAGAGGPSAQSVFVPANINTNEVNVWATGVVDYTPPFIVYSPSGRGPSQCYSSNPALNIKPEACAGGVNVRSAVPGNGYNVWSGSSMAAAHVTGAVGLLKEIYPNKTGHEIKLALYNTATDLGTEGEDNIYGRGLIDLQAAYLALKDSSITGAGLRPAFKVPAEFKLYDNYPNPFNPATNLQYDIPQNGRVSLEIFTLCGKKITTLVDEKKQAGKYRVEWNGLDRQGRTAASGIYLVRLQYGNYTAAKKVILIK